VARQRIDMRLEPEMLAAIDAEVARRVEAGGKANRTLLVEEALGLLLNGRGPRKRAVKRAAPEPESAPEPQRPLAQSPQVRRVTSLRREKITPRPKGAGGGKRPSSK
jgi:hypothetical protein